MVTNRLTFVLLSLLKAVVIVGTILAAHKCGYEDRSIQTPPAYCTGVCA